MTIEEVKERCSTYGWTLLSTTYNSRKEDLEIMCEHGHKSLKSLDRIEAGRGCKECVSISQRIDIKTIREKFLQVGLTILTDSYKDAHTPIPVMCERGHYVEKTWQSVRKGYSCRECKYENNKGEGNPNYNHNLPDELRGVQRNYPEYYEWRRQVQKRDNYTCVACKKYGGKITTHHILNYSEYPKLREDVDNGVVMCVNCHKDFHKTYGRKNNSKEQLDEYCKNMEVMEK